MYEPMNALREIQAYLRAAEMEIAAMRPHEVLRALSILYRNPTAYSRKHKSALEELREILRGRKEKGK